jgi:hypothetical protein
MYLPDIVGTTEQILAALRADPVLPLSGHFRLELPSEFETADYRQILRDFTRIIPELK